MNRYIFLIISFFIIYNNAADLSKLITENYVPIYWTKEKAEIFQSFTPIEQGTLLKNVLPLLPIQTGWHFLNIMDSVHKKQMLTVDSNEKLCLSKINIFASITLILSSSTQMEAKTWTKGVFYEGFKSIIESIADVLLSHSLNTGLIPFATSFFVLNHMSPLGQRIFFEHVYSKWPFLENKYQGYFVAYNSILNKVTPNETDSLAITNDQGIEFLRKDFRSIQGELIPGPINTELSTLEKGHSYLIKHPKKGIGFLIILSNNEQFFSHQYPVFVGIVGGLMKKHLLEKKRYSSKQITAINKFIASLELDPSHDSKKVLDSMKLDFWNVVIDAATSKQNHNLKQGQLFG